MKSTALFSILLLPITLASPIPAPIPQVDGGVPATPARNCYTDARATRYNPDVITLFAILNSDPNGTPDYPWEVTWGSATIRVNGETKIRKARAVEEAQNYIVNWCLEDGRVGGLVDMGSHRVRIATVGT